MAAQHLPTHALALLCVCLLAVLELSAATNVYVSPTGSPDADGASASTPVRSLSDAFLIDSAASTRVVHLQGFAFPAANNTELSVPADTVIVGDGATIDCEGARAFYVTGAGWVNVTGTTFSDCTPATGRGGAISAVASIGVSTSMYMRDVRFTGCSATMGGAVAVSGLGARLLCDDCFFDGNEASKGGALYQIESDVAMHNATFSANTALLGGAVCMDSASLELLDSRMLDNDAYSAGGLYSFLSTVTYVGGLIRGNEGTDDDVGGFFMVKTDILLEDLDFEDNFCGDDAGAVKVHMETDSQVMRNLRFTGNVADDKGGAMYISDGAVDVSNCTFENNVGGIGGALIFSGGANTARDLVFRDNEASEGGASLYLRKLDGDTTVYDIVSHGGTAPNGGAIACERADGVTLTDVEIYDAVADETGGGFSADDRSDVTLVRVTIEGCSAPVGGAASFYCPAVMEDCLFTGNEATEGDAGGAFVADGADLALTGGSVSDNTAAAGSGGAIAVEAGGAVAVAGGALFEGNSAGVWGGALFVAEDASGSVAGATVVRDNTATEAGGGIFRHSRAAAWSEAADTEFSGNAGSYGEAHASEVTTLGLSLDAGGTAVKGGSTVAVAFEVRDAYDQVAVAADANAAALTVTSTGNSIASMSYEADELAAGAGSLALVLVANPLAAVDVTWTYLAGGEAAEATVSFTLLECESTEALEPYDGDDTDTLFVCVEQPQYELLEVDEVALSVVLPLVALCALALASLCGLMWAKRSVAVFRGASPKFSLTAFVGSFLCLVGAVLFAMDPAANGDGLCVGRLWVFSSGAVGLLACLAAKTYRVYKVFFNKKLKGVALKDQRLFALAMRVVAVQWALNLLWTVLDPPQVELYVDDDSLKMWYGCSSNDPIVALSLLWFYAICVGAAVLSYQVRNCPSYFNESKWLALGMYTILLCSAIYLGIMFGLEPTPTGDAVFRASITVVCLAVCMGLIFGSKAHLYFSGQGDNDLLSTSAGTQGTMAQATSARSGRSAKSGKIVVASVSRGSANESEMSQASSQQAGSLPGEPEP